MKFFKSLFSGNGDHPDMKLRFVKSENLWHVIQGQAIMYIGEKDKCLKYMAYAKAS